jgi:hypothetical protein
MRFKRKIRTPRSKKACNLCNNGFKMCYASVCIVDKQVLILQTRIQQITA